eukprot:scaffold32029_cov80-Skeletonema_marinoi.AAC.1
MMTTWKITVLRKAYTAVPKCRPTTSTQPIQMHHIISGVRTANSQCLAETSSHTTTNGNGRC